jgi:hypothetical protein
MAKQISSSEKPQKIKVKRPGIHSKSKFSSIKSSKNYNKKYIGQGN